MSDDDDAAAWFRAQAHTHFVRVDREVYGKLVVLMPDPTEGCIDEDAVLDGRPWVDIPVDCDIWNAALEDRHEGETVNDVFRRQLGMEPLKPMDDR